MGNQLTIRNIKQTCVEIKQDSYQTNQQIKVTSSCPLTKERIALTEKHELIS